MTTQPEAILEQELMAQLVSMGYEAVAIQGEKELLANLKTQLEKHNKVSLTDQEFKQVLNHINKGNIFNRAKALRDRVPYQNAEGDTLTLELINQIHWCQNLFQVTHQVSMEGNYKNRYDVTLLINGLPLVQLELKRRGLELKEAFNQTNRYERHSYGAGYGLFQYIQLFVISNGLNTKYYANNAISARSFKQTFYWSDEQNKKITNLSAFTETFLEKCHISKMITKYIVLNESQKILMVLRPYQYYATEAIIERVKNTTDFGYIWHTTGSGKTLTSFKAAQILTHMPHVHKVVFVVDRKDLDYQTTKEFNSFSKGSIDGTNNTRTLVKQMTGHHKLIVTTIQKLNTAISKTRYLGEMEALKDKRVVFIFDECHRSQFGKTHDEIRKFFQACQMFGFTGTPIFEENATGNAFGKRTTTMLFHKCLHKYVITDAIRDENVLKFSIEYMRTFKLREGMVDIDIEAIDKSEVMDDPRRMEDVVDYILANHRRKTHNARYTAIFCVSSIQALISYYHIFRRKWEAEEHTLKLATIFSYQANEEDQEAMGFTEDTEFLGSDDYSMSMAAETQALYETKHSRDHLEDFMGHYNAQFRTNFTTRDSKSFYNYYNDIAKRVKAQQIDILLVVNMFLTGFDSKFLNTLYVDKNLKHHGLIQAYSRTNRILDEMKSQGNIVSFRNLKQATDDAIALFSNLDAKDEIIMAPYETYVKEFNQAYGKLLALTPTINSVDELPSEEEEFEFVKAFRELMRAKNTLSTFTDFDFEDLAMPEQLFEDYKSKYLDLHDKVKQSRKKEKVSILMDLDFELELIHRDEINVAYILKLLGKLKDASPEEQDKQKKKIVEMVAGETQLRSKRELIEKFIQQNLPLIPDSDDIPDAFAAFWEEQKSIALNKLQEEEKLDPTQLQRVISDYLWSEKEPMRQTIIEMMEERPKLKERKPTAERITEKILGYVETFIDGLGG